MREVIMTGKTVEEATEKACAELGKGRDEVSVEILEMPVKKLFKNIPAKVRVIVDGEEEAAAPKVEEKPAPAPAPAPKAAEKPEVKPAEKVAEKPAEKTPNKPAKKEAVLAQEPEIEIDPANNPAAKRAVDYLTGVFSAMGADDIKVQVLQQGEATLLRVEGSSISNVIETRGETIQALSYLTDRTVNRGIDKKDEQYMRVRLDVAGYRSRRESELVALAERIGKEVAESKRSRTLAPMNPYERLIIHTRVSEMEGIISESIGSDTERRVVIKSTAPDAVDGEDWRPGKSGAGRGGRSGGGSRGGNRRNSGGNRGDRGGRGGRDSRDRNDRGPRPPRTNTPEREYANKSRDEGASPVVPKRREAIKDGEDLPLYGKIEL